MLASVVCMSMGSSKLRQCVCQVRVNDWSRDKREALCLGGLAGSLVSLVLESGRETCVLQLTFFM